MIPSDAVERVKDALRISDVVGRKVKLRRSGRIWEGCCPFHKEKTPSFKVDDARGTWHCFGACNEGGDVIEFVRKAQGLSFVEAIEQLARDAGVDLPKANPEAIRREAQRLSLIEVLEEAREWFRAQFKASEEAKAYVKTRGITQEQVERYSVGFAPGDRSALKSALGPGCGLERLSQAGLVRVEEGSALASDRFRGRVVVPIRDARGRTVSFTGRILAGEGPKWINGPETDVFLKGSTVFNFDRARQPAHDGAPVLVCEGPFDVMACERAGYPAAVCTMGTAFTPEHLKTLWRLSDEPVLLFDGDPAGQKAAAKAMGVAFPLLVPGRGLRVVQLPSGSDPDDLVRVRGPGALKAAVEGSTGLADAFWRVSVAGVNMTDPSAVGKLEHEMMEAFSAIPDDNLRRRYREDARNRIRRSTAPRPIVRSNGFSNHSTNPGALRLVHGLPQRAGFTTKEACILAAAVSHPGLLGDALEGLNGLSSRAQQVMDEILHLVTELPDIEAGALMSALQAKGIAPAIEEAYGLAHDAGIVALDPGGDRGIALKVLKP
jgi:DNA primase